MATLATIKGIPYEKGQAFVCAADATGWSISNGSGLYATLTKDTTYYLTLYEPGAKYPYGVGSNTAESSTLGWFDTTPFPAGTFTVTYDANGGDLNGIAKTQTKIYEIDLIIPSIKPERTGYTFKEWNTEPDGSGYSAEPEGSIVADESKTMYAIWEINYYTVTYDANGGTFDGEETYSYEVPYFYAIAEKDGELPLATRLGYNLNHWNTEEDGSGTRVSYDTKIGSADLYLYAQWEPAASIVTLYLPNENGVTEKKRGMVHMYNSLGNLCYAIMTIYDKNGKGHLAN